MIEVIKQEAQYVLVKVDLTEANLTNADVFKQQVIGLIDEHHQNLIIDLKKVEYVDSSFLGALVAILKHAISIKTEVLLIELRKDIHDLMALIRLDKVFKIYKSLPEAVQSLS